MSADPYPRITLRASVDVQGRIRDAYRLARLVEGRRVTMDELIRRAVVAYGVQLRRRARAAGIDVEAALRAVPGKSRGPFTGPPEKHSPRVYDHGPP